MSEREILKRKRLECERHLCSEVKIMVVEWLVWLADKRPASSPFIVFMMLSYTKQCLCITKIVTSCGTTHSGALASPLWVYWLAFRMD